MTDMVMSPEYLPSIHSGSGELELVLLHGWGSGPDIWRPLLVALRPWANVTLLEIPGCSPACGEEPVGDLAQVLAGIMDACPPSALFAGWSLGGQLAAEVAARYPERVAGVVTLCSNPRFVAEGDWPGMAPDEFESFQAAVAGDPRSALRRFDSLQATGSARSRQLLREIPRRGRERAGAALLTGLQWLYELDLRASLTDLTQPQLHLLAGRDALVPAELQCRLARLLEDRPRAGVRVLKDSSHLVTLECGEQVATAIRDFAAEQGLLGSGEVERDNLAKGDVAASFSRAAESYDSVASLQRDVGTRLLDSLEQAPAAPESVLDLGCGTGYFYPALRQRYPDAEYIGLDLARGMVEYARARHPGAGRWLVGDAEALPLEGDSVDLVFSSLAIQWCDHPRLLFAELARVLRPGGVCVFTSLGPDTLRELRAAWAAVDSHQHVNRFLPASALEDAAASIPGVRLEQRSEGFRMDYQRVRELLDELKALGAHNMNRRRPAGLTSRRSLQGMLQAYEDWRRDGLLPATYDVIFGYLEKA